MFELIIHSFTTEDCKINPINLFIGNLSDFDFNKIFDTILGPPYAFFQQLS